MTKKGGAICRLLFLVVGGIGLASATTPDVSPEDDWQKLSALLADRTVSADWRDSHGHSIVYLQLLYGSEQAAVDYLQSDKPRKIRMEGNDRLMSAAIRVGSQRVVSALLSGGETPNSIAANNESPLMQATSLGRLEIMRMLLRAGAEIDYSINLGRRRAAVHEALEHGETRALHLLIDAGLNLDRYRKEQSTDSLIFSAIVGGSPSSLHVLYENSFAMNGPHLNGETPLTFAVSTSASRQMVQALLGHGADPCMANASGETAVRLATESDLRAAANELKYADLFEGTCEDAGRKP